MRFVCGNCGHAVEAWSDGNPYYIDEAETRQCAYHPDHERLARCIGNDAPHVCLDCGHEFNVDSRDPLAECPKCMAAEIVRSYNLDARRCPYCKAGAFTADPGFFRIS